MFGSLTALLAVVGLAALSAGGIAYTLLYGRIQTEDTAEKRLEFIQGKSFADYESNAMLRAAVEPQLETVGEALAQLARIDPAAASQMSEYRRIIAFRNILIHGYAEIDHRIVWNVLELKLPVLYREAEALLGREG